MKNFWILITGMILLGANAVTISGQSTCANTGFRFKSAKFIPTGMAPAQIVVADFNQDGKLDFANLQNSEPFQNLRSAIEIQLGNGQGEFAIAKVLVFPYIQPYANSFLRSGDVNGDGKIDLVLILYSGIKVWLGDGQGDFAAPVDYPLPNITGPPIPGTTPRIVVTDVNADGRADVIAMNNELMVYLAAADGSLSNPKRTTLSSTMVLHEAVDLNGDGKPELIALPSSGSSLAIFQNDGDGKFSAPVIINLSFTSFVVAVGDFTGDQRPEIITTTINGTTELLTNNGVGGFSGAKTILNRGLSTIVPGDFNKDGKLDFAFTQTTSNTNYLADLGICFGDGVGNFLAPVPYTLTKNPNGLWRGDFNRDGLLDLMATETNAAGVNIVWGEANGNFTSGALTKSDLSNSYGSYGGRLTVADVNNDGITDVVGGGVFTGYLFQGRGNGSFKDSQVFDNRFKLGQQFNGSLIADVNKDGNADLIFATSYVVPGTSTANSSITVITGSSANGFQETAAKAYTVGSTPGPIITVDFNADGWPDLATANAGSNSVSILLNNTQGQFLPALNITTGLEPRSLAAADFNGDMLPDVVVANRNSAGISLLLNDGAGGFNPSLLGIGANPRAVQVQDVNGDGKPDILIAQDNAAFLTVLLGNGNGTFAPRINNAISARVYDYAAIDFNRDGKLDLVMTLFPVSNSSGSETQDRFVLYYGDGTGQFYYGWEMLAASPTYLLLNDFNGDAIPDLMASSTFGIQTYPGVCNAPPSATNVVTVNAASYTGIDVAPEGIVSAFGTDLSSSTVVATIVPLPLQLGNTTVKVKDSKGVERTAPLFFVSPAQVNYQIPAGTALGFATITVINGAIKTSTGSVLVTTVKPGIFTANADGVGVIAANALRILSGTGQQVYEPVSVYDAALKRFVPVPVFLPLPIQNPDKLYIILYGTGIRGRSNLDQVRALIDGKPFTVEYAGAHCCFIGVDQLNIRIENNLPARGEVDVKLEVDGKFTNLGKVMFQ